MTYFRFCPNIKAERDDTAENIENATAEENTGNEEDGGGREGGGNGVEEDEDEDVRKQINYALVQL